MSRVNGFRFTHLPVLSSLLLLAACAGGQAPRANCFSFAERPSGVTVSTMGGEVARAADPCAFTLLGAVD
ncbi:hypothetical protein [Pseudogemmobacter bohemicus]|uniref:hypothetical protein n=1 Tax=Pseudogemmobacter bohemicus TaxID=2250708 RepID=UPI000DD3F220|nr:hypothetical protein [Pseudogemmobacter bohemicus]